MFGRLIGAVAGAQAAKHTAKVGGTGGALLGAIAVPMIARLSIPALAVVGVGGYFAKKAYDRRQEREARKTTKSSTKRTTSAA